MAPYPFMKRLCEAFVCFEKKKSLRELRWQVPTSNVDSRNTISERASFDVIGLVHWDSGIILDESVHTLPVHLRMNSHVLHMWRGSEVNLNRESLLCCNSKWKRPYRLYINSLLPDML